MWWFAITIGMKFSLLDICHFRGTNQGLPGTLMLKCCEIIPGPICWNHLQAGYLQLITFLGFEIKEGSECGAEQVQHSRDQKTLWTCMIFVMAFLHRVLSIDKDNMILVTMCRISTYHFLFSIV